jgi:histidinol-phosphate/aromatic aminotransferase/cobyric acid decarboxylase-like protein
MYPMLWGWLRVNAGTPAENDAFLHGLRGIMTEVEG